MDEKGKPLSDMDRIDREILGGSESDPLDASYSVENGEAAPPKPVRKVHLGPYLVTATVLIMIAGTGYYYWNKKTAAERAEKAFLAEIKKDATPVPADAAPPVPAAEAPVTDVPAENTTPSVPPSSVPATPVPAPVPEKPVSPEPTGRPVADTSNPNLEEALKKIRDLERALQAQQAKMTEMQNALTSVRREREAVRAVAKAAAPQKPQPVASQKLLSVETSLGAASVAALLVDGVVINRGPQVFEYRIGQTVPGFEGKLVSVDPVNSIITTDRIVYRLK